MPPGSGQRLAFTEKVARWFKSVGVARQPEGNREITNQYASAGKPVPVFQHEIPIDGHLDELMNTIVASFHIVISAKVDRARRIIPAYLQCQYPSEWESNMSSSNTS